MIKKNAVHRGELKCFVRKKYGTVGGEAPKILSDWGAIKVTFISGYKI